MEYGVGDRCLDFISSSAKSEMIASASQHNVSFFTKSIKLSVTCNYHNKFIYIYPPIAKSLYALLVVFELTSECEKAFDKLK